MVWVGGKREGSSVGDGINNFGPTCNTLNSRSSRPLTPKTPWTAIHYSTSRTSSTLVCNSMVLWSWSGLTKAIETGNFKHLCDNPLPPTSEPEFLATLCYTARSHIALKNYPGALGVLPNSDSTPPVKSLRSLANYLAATGEDKDTYLEELRDLCIEVEDGFEGDDEEGAGSGLVKVVAATAFFNEGELEEALTTLGAGCKSRDLEW